MILCAAVKFHIYSTGKDVIIPCRRHKDAYEKIKDMDVHTYSGVETLEEGFITTGGLFLNRVDACKHALLCGQISDTVKRNMYGDVLFSEDLY